jgi:hypothetical protein
MIVVAVAHPIGCKMVVVTVETMLVHLRMPCQKGCLQGRALKNLRIATILHCCTTNSSAKENGDGDAESLLS